MTSNEETVDVAKLLFSTGAAYSKQFPDSYAFKDISNNKCIVDKESFIHYNDGGIGAFSKGVVVNMADLGQGYLEFYGVSPEVQMTKNSVGWSVDTNHHNMDFNEILWQLSEDTILAGSDQMTITIAGREIENVSGYAEVRWIDKDIVQIATAEKAWQIVASGSAIRFASGSTLDLYCKEASDADGNVMFTLEDLSSDMAGAISLSTTKISDWTVPTFNVESQDGKDGTQGENGEDGEQGEAGEAGEAGEQGDAGGIGKHGDRGQDGAGGEGGNAGGSNHGHDRGEDSQKLASIWIADINSANPQSVEFTLAVEDEFGTLNNQDNAGVIEIRDAETNVIVWKEAVNLGKSILSSSDLYHNVTGLEPDHEYVLFVKHDYTAESNGVSVSGRKVFVRRHFTTSSEGLSAEVELVTEDTLYLTVNKSSTSGLTASDTLSTRIYVGNYYIDYPSDIGEGYGMNFPTAGSLNAQIPLGALLMTKYPEAADQFSSDMVYRMEFYKNVVAIDDEGVIDGTKFELSVDGQTLKRTPVITDVIAKTMNEANGQYELSVNVVQDYDNAITGYKFEIYTSAGLYVDSVEGSTNTVTWYYGGYLPPDSYYVEATVTYYDNEKTGNLSARVTRIVSAGSNGATSVVFQPYARSGGYFKDSLNNIISGVPNGEGSTAKATNKNRIWGDIVLTNGSYNARRLDASQPVTIQVRSESDPDYVDEWTTTINVRTGAQTGQYYIPVKVINLTPNTNYTFAVYGTAIINMNDVTRSYGYLGSVTYKTPAN